MVVGVKAALVQKVGYDWQMYCPVHDETIWCGDWQMALEAAYGHVAMYHPRLKPCFEVWVSDGRHSMSAFGISS